MNLSALSRHVPGLEMFVNLQFVVARAVTIARGGVLTAKHVDRGDEYPPRKSEKGDIDQELVQLVRQWTRENWNDGSAKSYMIASLISLNRQSCLKPMN